MKTIISASITISVVLFFVLYTLVGFDKVWDYASGNPDMGAVNFETFTKTDKPNQYLVCPEDYCNETPDTISQEYDINATTLFQLVSKYGENSTDLTLLDQNDEDQTIRFLSRSPILKFPDTTNIKVIRISENSSGLAIYAQAKLGVSDLGANKERINQMIVEIEKRITASK